MIMKTATGAALLLVLGAIAVGGCRASEATEGQSRARRDLRYRPAPVAYAYQHRTEQLVAGPPPIPVVPVTSLHVQSLLLRQVKPERPVPHFPTRRPMQAVDRLHTRVDIGQQQPRGEHRQQHRQQHHHQLPPAHPAPGTVIAHSHTEVYRAYA